ncbi:hypothetical protein WN944_014511 [Citrus x changshan-huyou]|uniref:Uncharacterized protein n=1 Tax=Citrus x changshan-huyou TaxID=2935761 RepID=A0AAP0M5T5_9ROSI
MMLRAYRARESVIPVGYLDKIITICRRKVKTSTKIRGEEKPLPLLFLLSHCRCSVSAVTAATPTPSSYCCSVFALPDLSLARPLYGGGNRTTDFRAAAADVIQVRAAATFFKFEHGDCTTRSRRRKKDGELAASSSN